MNVLQKIEQEQIRFDIPDFRAGDTVRVHIRIIEGSKERIQVFQGVVIRRRNGCDGGQLYGTEGVARRWRRKDLCHP